MPDAPQFMRDAAKQGLKYYEDGLGGDGLTPKTVREARDMAAGTVTENKWIRIAAWIARHMPDLDAPAANPDNEDYPSAGVVAHLLWGSGPSKSDAERAMNYANRIVDRIDAERAIRKAGGTRIIICDIDDTIVRAGTRVDRVWDYIQQLDGAIYLVTGRPESMRDDTVKLLDDLDITYSRLIMNPGSTADSAEYKKGAAEELLKTFDVVEAIENDAKTLSAYASLGIETTNPSDIEDNSGMNERAAAGELNVGDIVRWINGDEIEYGAVLTVTDSDAEVTIWDEEDGVWSETELVAVVPVANLEKIDALPEPDMESEDVPESVSAPEMERGKKSTVETRISGSRIELRETQDGMVFEGYAAIFDSPSEPLPFREKIQRGAFSRSLKTRNDVKLLWNHDSGQVLASTRAKTLSLVEDERGLKVVASLPNTSLGRDTAELLRRGDVDSMSFGFSVIKDSWNAEGSERTLNAVRLHEVSIVAWPAYTATAGTTSVRSFDKLAQRANVDSAALATALEKMEAGEDITVDDRDLLSRTIDALSPKVEGQVTAEDDLSMLLLKKKKLELLKGI